MTLEAEISELKSAVVALTKVTGELMALRSDAIETVKGAAAPKAAAGKAKADEKPKAEETAKADTGGEAYAGIKDMIAAYITGTDRPEERDARKAKVKSLLNHPKVKKADVETATAVDHIMETAAEAVRKNLTKFIDEGDLTQPAGAGDDDLGL